MTDFAVPELPSEAPNGLTGQPIMAEPIAFTVTRYRCPHCTRSGSKKPAIRDHIGRCWANPGNRTCRTCSAYELWPAEPDVGVFHDEQRCDHSIELPGDGTPVTGCALWTTKEAIEHAAR